MAVAASSVHPHAGRAEKSGFVMVPTDVARHAGLSDGAFRTYCVIRSYCYGRKNYCWPSVRTLAAHRDCTEETVRRHLRELEAAGLIVVYKSGRRNVYVLRDTTTAGEEDCTNGSLAFHQPCAAQAPTVTEDGEASLPSAAPTTAALAGHATESAPSSERNHSAPAACSTHGRESGDNPHLIAHTDTRAGGVMPHTCAPSQARKANKNTRQEVHLECEESTTPPDDAPRQIASQQLHPTARRLVAHGVSPAQARRLVTRHGYQLCEQAMELLATYLCQGARIRNPGGWLYCAITQGYLAPWDVRPDSLGAAKHVYTATHASAAAGPDPHGEGHGWATPRPPHAQGTASMIQALDESRSAPEGHDATGSSRAASASPRTRPAGAPEDTPALSSCGSLPNGAGSTCGEGGTFRDAQVPAESLALGAGHEKHSNAGLSHLSDVLSRREAALAARGVTPELDSIWQKIVADLRSQGQWDPVLAMSYMRRAADGAYTVECLVPTLAGRLRAKETAVRAAASHWLGQHTVVVLG